MQEVTYFEIDTSRTFCTYYLPAIFIVAKAVQQSCCSNFSVASSVLAFSLLLASSSSYRSSTR